MFVIPLYEVRYRDGKEWEEISENDLMIELYKIHKKITPVIKEMIKGIEIITPEAIYRLKLQGTNNRKSLYLNWYDTRKICKSREVVLLARNHWFWICQNLIWFSGYHNFCLGLHNFNKSPFYPQTEIIKIHQNSETCKFFRFSLLASIFSRICILAALCIYSRAIKIDYKHCFKSCIVASKNFLLWKQFANIRAKFSYIFFNFLLSKYLIF